MLASRPSERQNHAMCEISLQPSHARLAERRRELRWRSAIPQASSAASLVPSAADGR